MAEPGPDSLNINVGKLLTGTFAAGVLALVALANWPWTQASARQPAPARSAAEPTGPRPNFVLYPQAAGQYVEKLALQSGGDYFKLSPDDQDYLDHVTKRHGPEMMRMIFRQRRHTRARPAAAGTTGRTAP